MGKFPETYNDPSLLGGGGGEEQDRQNRDY